VAESNWAIEAARLGDALASDLETLPTRAERDSNEVVGEQAPKSATGEPATWRQSAVLQLLSELRNELERYTSALGPDWIEPAARVSSAVDRAAQACQRLRAETRASFVGRLLLGKELDPSFRRLLCTYAFAKQANAYLERLAVIAIEAGAVDRALESGQTNLQLAWDCWKRLHREEEHFLEELHSECQLIALGSSSSRGWEIDEERLRATLAERCGTSIGQKIQQTCRQYLRDLVVVAELQPEDIKQLAMITREEPSLLARMFPSIIREAVSRRARQHERTVAIASSPNAPLATGRTDAESSTANDWIRQALAGYDALPESISSQPEKDATRGEVNEYAAAGAPSTLPMRNPSGESITAASNEHEQLEVESQLATRVQALFDLLITDVRFVVESVAPLFEPSIAIGQWYALETNQLLNTFLWGVIARASLIPGKDILSLLLWIAKYQEWLRELFPAPPHTAVTLTDTVSWDRSRQEALLQGLEIPARRLVEGYAARALEMMRRWIRNCIKVDTEGPVDVRDDDETLYTQAPLDVFRIVNDEMTIVREHAQLGDPRFVQCISDACCAALLDYRTWSLDALDGIESEDGALERYCATVNNHRRCQQLAEQFAARCHTILDEVVYGLIDQQRDPSMTPGSSDLPQDTPAVKQVKNGHSNATATNKIDATTYALTVDRLAAEFAVSAEFAATRVCNVIFQDMDEAPGLWPRLYTPAWILGDEEIASSIVATVDDFFQDIDGYLRHEMDRAAVATECAIRIADRYAAALANYLGAISPAWTTASPALAESESSELPSTLSAGLKSRGNIAQRITGGGSSRLLRALGTTRDGNQSGRLGAATNSLACDRRMIDRLREDYAILAEHFLHARRGGSRARVARALAAMDALADMLTAAMATNPDALVTSYANLLDAKLSRSTLYLWQVSTLEKLLGSFNIAVEGQGSLETWRDALAACRRTWSDREQPI
jgi:hypothetical protein